MRNSVFTFVRRARGAIVAGVVLLATTTAPTITFGPASVYGQELVEPRACIYPEQRSIDVRHPWELRQEPLPNLGRPKTIANLEDVQQEMTFSLDDAIQWALENAEVIRILQGTAANSSGRTIYDPAITNTQVDAERSRFDPNLDSSIFYNRNENPSGAIDGAAPAGTSINALDVDSLNVQTGLTQIKPGGGTFSVNSSATPTDVAAPGLALNPQTPTSIDFGLTQPLLRGRGAGVNLAPIVIARIDTERSFYQLKDTVQEQVRSIIDGYWRLVAARVDLWARQQQVDQLEFAFKFIDAQVKVGRGDVGDSAQAEVSLQQFRANLISANATVLDREEAFFNALGIPPRPDVRLVPTTPPLRDLVDVEWEELLATATENRPDLIELRLQIEADRQRLKVACNNTLPQLDAVSLYRLNGLGGRTPLGRTINSDPFQFNDLQVGLNLRTPIGQRSTRAQLRREQITLARDEALLRQQLHQTTHTLAQNLRNIEQFYAQYRAFQRVREASRVNVERQFDVFRIGGIGSERPNYLNVLQAVTDWGNAISSEALALAQYNAELASLQLQAGTILEQHGILFQEECYGSLAPLCRKRCASYPYQTPVGPNERRYASNPEAAEKAFDLETPVSPTDSDAPDSRDRSSGDAADASEDEMDRELRELRERLERPSKSGLTPPSDAELDRRLRELQRQLNEPVQPSRPEPKRPPALDDSLPPGGEEGLQRLRDKLERLENLDLELPGPAPRPSENGLLLMPAVPTATSVRPAPTGAEAVSTKSTNRSSIAERFRRVFQR